VGRRVRIVCGLICCSVLQCVAVCCSVVQCVAVWCSAGSVGREWDGVWRRGVGGWSATCVWFDVQMYVAECGLMC